MSGSINVQGGYPNDGPTQDQAVLTGGEDVGGNLRPVLTDANGAVNITGKDPSGGASTSNPIQIGALQGTNAQALRGNLAGQLLTDTSGQKKTYSVGFILTPDTAATDIAALAWGTTGLVRLVRASISFIGSAAGTRNVQLLKRSTANSGGTAATPTPVPHDSADGVADAVVTTYTGNPTLGTSLGALAASKVGISAASGLVTITWDYSNRNDKAPTLRSANQALAINLHGDTDLTGESVAGFFEWTESTD